VAVPLPLPPAAETPRNTITVSRTNSTATVTPLLSEAYAALEANTLDEAQRLYTQLLRAEPKNIDALLGLAAIATQEGKTEDATRRYLQILEIDPRHALAQSGLIALLGRADPLAAESRLKQLIARERLPFLYFTLGNLYADQSLWAQAQAAYFQAHHLDPANADYAYNLAVGLEHVNQPKLALGYYRRAIELASIKGHVNFSQPQAQERIAKLASRVE
jgi:tetratricopeptide (TPR) repeat protein